MAESAARAPDPLVRELARHACERFGLRLPKERLAELARALRPEHIAAGRADPEAAARFLLESEGHRATLDLLAAHLTVGETFFYREPLVFSQLEQSLLPELTRRAAAEGRGVKILSAGCSTGEEAYSAAIALHRVTLGQPPPASKVIGADINAKALEAARRGLYREWSFRGAKTRIKEGYFRKTGQGVYAISPMIAKMTAFHRLNLARGALSGQVAELAGLDLIFCRNVLMYFSPQAAARAVDSLLEVLRPGGLLVVSPSEAMFVKATPLELAGTGGTAIYRKPGPGERARAAPGREVRAARTRPRPILALAAAAPKAALPAAAPSPRAPEAAQADEALYPKALDLYHAGRYAEAADELEAWLTHDPEARDEPGLYAREITLLARILANLGRPEQAAAWCETLVRGDALSPEAQFALGTALRDAGRPDEAGRAFARALYLDGGFVAAELALAGLCRDRGETVQAAKHYANVATLLANAPDDSVVPQSGGLTAAAIREFAATLRER
jgi:chemotaxis protein methyltransferase CheR